MWDVLWLNVHLATGDEALVTAGNGYGCISNGAVGVRDGAICRMCRKIWPSRLRTGVAAG
ncbi:hypothetical protein WH240_13100 [Gluconobacter wancherniae]|uniref:hypothetical protein n=1 Tax=Gluconobacter wancherniae TaxID=1307955 RepID=UPI0030A38358